MARTFRDGTLVMCVSDEHKRNVPIGSVGVVKKFDSENDVYCVRWFAYPDIDDEDPEGRGYIPDYFAHELEEVTK